MDLPGGLFTVSRRACRSDGSGLSGLWLILHPEQENSTDDSRLFYRARSITSAVLPTALTPVIGSLALVRFAQFPAPSAPCTLRPAPCTKHPVYPRTCGQDGWFCLCRLLPYALISCAVAYDLGGPCNPVALCALCSSHVVPCAYVLQYL
jgi:hypothetical protein